MNATNGKTPERVQQQLQLTYSVGDWVWVKAAWSKRRHLLARIESATPIESADGDLWCVRAYYSRWREQAKPASAGGWSKGLEHRLVDRALNPAEIADLRRQGTIPPAGSSVLP